MNKYIITLILVLSFCIPCFSTEVPLLWNGLEPGEYAVGFQLLHMYDHSRTFRLEKDYLGNVNNGEISRPVQVSLWYPAEVDDSSVPVKFLEYLSARATEIDFSPLTKQRIDNEIAFLMRHQAPDRKDEARFLEIISRNMYAVKNARPKEGGFPVLIYGCSINSSPHENAALFEYLASHGYIIAALPSIGMYSRAMTRDTTGIEAHARDLEFALSYLRSFKTADCSRLGFFGFSWGGITNLIAALRNTSTDAIISLDGAIGPRMLELLKNHPGFDYKNMHAAFLDVASFAKDGLDTSLYDQLKYSNAHVLHCLKMHHAAFGGTNLKLFIEVNSGFDRAKAKDLMESSRYVSMYIKKFFDAYLLGDANALGYIKNEAGTGSMPEDLFESKSKTAMKAPPTEVEFFNIMAQRGVEEARAIYDRFKKEDPGVVMFSEEEMNTLGYTYLQAKMHDRAIEIFKLNTDAYPDSANVYDSLAEAYLAAGRTDLARRYYKKAFLMNPENKNARQILDKLGEE